MKEKKLFYNEKILNKNVLYFIINDLFKYFQKYFIINIYLINNADILQLNYLYKNKFYITDILSFNYNINSNIIIGDIYICKNLFYFKSIFYCINIEYMFLILIIHGILHLLSYKHNNDFDFKKMRFIENKFLILFKKKYFNENYFRK